jgi:large subunit ribosomal protein L6
MVSYQKYTVKIPEKIEILHHIKNNVIVIIGRLGKKVLRFKTKIIIDNKLKIVELTTDSLFIKNNVAKKKIKSYQGTSLSLLKQSFLEVSVFLYKKIKLIGIGYKAFIENIFDQKFLILKLGYSHNIYFKIPLNITVTCLKSDKIFIMGNSYEKMTQIASIIKSYKLPEPYKGKGILYENEKILLKEGKKI